MDPHYPYDSVTTKGSSFQRYLAEVGEADKRIGELEDAIDRLGLRSRTVLIVAADHGEAFGQHDTQYHTSTLYEELIRVPLFIRAPVGPARHVQQPVTLMDLGPTILDLYGLATPATFLGQSLVPLLRGEDPTLTRPIAAERIETRAFVIGDRKIVVDTEKGLRQIFDLSKDPNETHNLVDELGPRGEADIELMEGFFEAHAVEGGLGSGRARHGGSSMVGR
jgi:arylsulfatase A-like enzyme